MKPPILSDLIAKLGPNAVLDTESDMTPYLVEWRGVYESQALAIVRPANTEEVATTVRLCAQAGIAIVPMGGNTGLVGGAVAQRNQIILSTERLNQLHAIDPDNNTMTVGAGMILADVQAHARAAGRLFPLSLGAQGSCRIGGNLSSNAGGVHVLRYGNARDLVLGIEVVLPDGQIWNGLTTLRKDNTGYDLKHLFLGGEGTLGIITAAALKLFPQPVETETAFVAIKDPNAALALLTKAKSHLGERLSAFEIMPRRSLEFALNNVERTRDPLAEPHPWYALIEFDTSTPNGDLADAVQTLLAEADEVLDATMAQNASQRLDLWHIREAIVEGQRSEGVSLKHDVSIPVSSVPAFIDRAIAACEQRLPGIRPVAFGHLGDGNIHFNLSQPIGMDPEAYAARRGEFRTLVHDIVASMRGSISAEHGIGLMKRDEMVDRKQPQEMALMRSIKRAIDPQNLMNPGKVIDMDAAE